MYTFGANKQTRVTVALRLTDTERVEIWIWCKKEKKIEKLTHLSTRTKKKD